MSITIKDTPPKAPSHSVNPSSRATAKDVMQAVKQDLDGSVVLTPSDFFLRNILDIDKSASLPSFLEAVLKKHYDNNQHRWRDLPTDDKLEDAFYGPFVRLANEIADKTVQAFPNDEHTVRGQWIDCHSISPTKTTDSVADIRPDCAFVPNADLALELREQYYSLKEEMAAGSNNNKQEQVEKIRQLWWSQIVVAAEMKRAKKTDKSDRDAQYRGALPQLCGYIRQVFRQQLDRRFALGITISFNNIAVWLCDRSGALGMSEVCNIHSDPRTFVRIISAVSHLPSYRLGYDPTIQLYDSSLKGFQFSHQIPRSKSNPPPQLTESKWSLTVTDNRDLREHKVILDGPPLLARSAEVMNGRAVQVHQGYLKEDLKKPYRSPLVIKTSWQPSTKIKEMNGSLVSFEAYFYSLIPAFKDRVLAASVVMADHGWGNTRDISDAISTMKHIRKRARADIKTTTEINRKIRESLSRKEDLDERKEPLAFLAFGNATPISSDHLYFAEDPLGLTDRFQTRIVLNVWGYALKYFTCREELLRNIKSTIQEHLKMLEANVLHRDLSNGNIIMQPMGPVRGVNIRDLVSQTTGKLIDLDHAKGTKKTKTVGNLAPSPDKVQRYTHAIRFDFPVTEGAVAQAFKFVDHESITRYCGTAIRFDVMKSKSDEGDWTTEDLGWNDVGPQPDFDSHTPDVAKRTGTIPFISHRLMTQMAIPDTHNAIHDMESLLWVLIHICLVRDSGGGHRPKDPPEEPETPEEPKTPTKKPEEPETPEQRKRREESERRKKERRRIAQRKTYIADFFHSDEATIGGKKAKYFDPNSDEPFKDLLNHIHDYFDPFKDLLQRWRNVLVLGYTFHAYEYYLVHHYIMKIIDDTIAHPEVQNEDKNTPVIQQELARRAKDYQFICKIPDIQGGNPSSSVNPLPLASPPSLPSPASRAQAPQSAPRVPQTAPNRASASTSTILVGNQSYPSVPTLGPSSNRLPPSFPSSASSSSRPSGVVPASVPTTPPSNPGRANPSAVPRQTHTSPKMPIPKKARKE